jgi:type IV secretory pathway VirB10-like protein
MPSNMRVHLAAAGLLALIATVIVVFWTYPRLLVYLLLVIVAVLAYGALYLILAAWMDPKKADASEPAAAPSRPARVEAPRRAQSSEEPPDVAGASEPAASPSVPARVEAPASPEEPPKRPKKARKKRAKRTRPKRKARPDTDT